MTATWSASNHVPFTVEAKSGLQKDIFCSIKYLIIACEDPIEKRRDFMCGNTTYYLIDDQKSHDASNSSIKQSKVNSRINGFV